MVVFKSNELHRRKLPEIKAKGVSYKVNFAGLPQKTAWSFDAGYFESKNKQYNPMGFFYPVGSKSSACLFTKLWVEQGLFFF